jgi:protein-disulfide isomerase
MCPTCMAIYFVTIVQALILFFTREGVPGPWSIKSITNGGWYGITALAAVIALYQIFKPHPSNLQLDNPKTLEEIAAVQQEAANKTLGPLAMLDSNVSESVKIDTSAYSGMGEDYRVGSDDAKVKVVEFADFQCPACGHASSAIKQLHSEFGDRVLIVFKNYPLDNTCNQTMNVKMHQYACEAAFAARCAGSIGKFWDMYYKLFENQNSIDSTRLLAWQKEAGLSDQQIKECKTSKDILNKIQDDAKQASAAGLQGTPTIFVNGKKFNGQVEFESLRAVVQALLDS